MLIEMIRADGFDPSAIKTDQEPLTSAIDP